MILSVTLNPCLDTLLWVDSLTVSDTNRVLRVEEDAGGKGVNLSRVFANLGGQTAATGFLGGANGEVIRAVSNAAGVQDRFVSVANPTRQNISIEQEGGAPPTTLNQKGGAIAEDEITRLKEVLTAEPWDWVCFAGSAPPPFASSVYKELGSLVPNSKLMIDADGELLTLGLQLRPHLIKPNVAEASRFLGRALDTTEAVISAAKQLYAEQGSGDRYVVISRGKAGAVMTCSAGTFIGDSPAVESRSTIGSGDSMIAGMLWGMTSGASAQDILRWGLAAGAGTATTDGAHIGSKGVIELLFDDARVTAI